MPRAKLEQYKVIIVSWEVSLSGSNDIKKTPKAWVPLRECTTMSEFEKALIDIQRVKEITSIKYMVVTPAGRRNRVYLHTTINKILARNASK